VVKTGAVQSVGDGLDNALAEAFNGLAGMADGAAVIIASRSVDTLSVSVQDEGAGLLEGKAGEDLGTHIVKTLVQGELGESNDWWTLGGQGTQVPIDNSPPYLQE
jgi:hypothetical protein